MALATATFMNVLDSSIANVSIPAIAGDMGVSPAQGIWVITSFGVATAISVPLTGWLTQRFGQVRLMIGSTLAFVLFSWLCGMAPTIEWLIVFRILQGLAAGPTMPLSQTLLLASYPPQLAGTALAWWSMTAMVGPVAGPLLGGWITDNFAWPWIFYINVPIGLVAAAVIWSIYRDRDSPARRVPVDAVGLVLLIVWIGALQMMIDTGKEEDWFESTHIVMLAIVAAIGLAIFVIWELTEEHPIVNVRLFRESNFTLGTVVLSLSYGLFFGSVVLLPLWLQQSIGYTATWAGIVTAPVGVFSIIFAPTVGRMLGRVDPRRLASIGFICFALTMWMRSRFTVEVTVWEIVAAALLQGVATTFFFMPMQPLIYRGLPPSQMPAAAGLSNAARMTAGAFGASLSTTLWQQRTSIHHEHLVESLHPGNPAAQAWLEQAERAGYTPEQSLALLNRMVDQQAATLGATDVFLLAAVLFVGILALLWVLRPPNR